MKGTSKSKSSLGNVKLIRKRKRRRESERRRENVKRNDIMKGKVRNELNEKRKEKEKREYPRRERELNKVGLEV